MIYKEGYECKCNDILVKVALRAIREGLNNRVIANLTEFSIEAGLDDELISKLTCLTADEIKLLRE